MRPWLFLAAANGLMAVVAGAYNWHFLDAEEYARQAFAMGVQYQLWHALAMLAVAWLADRGGGVAGDSRPDSGSGSDFGLGPRPVRLAGWAFTLGMALFSGSLYAFGITGEIQLGGAAPAGGLCLMVGWAALMWAAFRRPSL